MYVVYDSQDRKIVGTYKSWKRAVARADALDINYGAVRYVVLPWEG